MVVVEVYQDEYCCDLMNDVCLLVGVLMQVVWQNLLLDDGDLWLFLGDYQVQIQCGLCEVYIIDGCGMICVWGECSYQFWYEQFVFGDFDQVKLQGLVLIQDWQNNEFCVFVLLLLLVDWFLYVMCDVDGKLLSLLDDMCQSVGQYQQFEVDWGKVFLCFLLLYLGFVLFLVVVVMWLGLWFVDRLLCFIGWLVEVLEQVGKGNLDLQIFEFDIGDEIQMLG